MIYSVIHFFILQRKGYSDRTTYEKVVSWVAIVAIGLIFLSVMMGN